MQTYIGIQTRPFASPLPCMQRFAYLPRECTVHGKSRLLLPVHAADGDANGGANRDANGGYHLSA